MSLFDEVKAFLKSPDEDDNLVNSLLGFVVKFIESYLDYKLIAQDFYKEVHRGNSQSISVANRPLNKIFAVGISTGAVMTISTSLTADVMPRIIVRGTTLELKGNETVSIDLTGKTLTSLAEVISGSSNWTAEVSQGYAQLSAIYLKDDIYYLHLMNSVPVEAYIDFVAPIHFVKEGIIYFSEELPEWVAVYYNAGCAVIPDDLKSIIMMMVQTLYEKYNMNAIGVESWATGPIRVNYDSTLFPESLIGLLRNYAISSVEVI